jgi:DNA-binding IclR family transcriptional regulator
MRERANDPVRNSKPTKQRNPSQIQVISRAAAVLRTLENESEGLSLGAIAQRLDLPRSTIQRIVGALEAEDLLIAASPKARVRLGPALVRLAASVETSAAKLAKPLMIQLAKELGETIDLSVMARDHAVFIERVIGSHSVYAIAAIAAHYPLHCTANGRAMLAELSDADIEQRIGRSYERRTARSLTNFKDLIAALRPVRRSGVAYSYEENALGVCAVGVAFRDTEGNLLSLSVPVPTSRFEELKKQIAQRLLEAKGLLQRRLGGG